MPRAAKRFVHIWADTRNVPIQSPACRGFFALIVLTGVIVLLDGCVTASPRFGSGSKGSATRSTSASGKEGARFGGKEAEEESKEDDKRPAPETIKSATSDGRSFTTEKNDAIKPLDQSRMMREISRFMGVPYLLGGQDMKGMDCSGYTMTVFKNSMNKLLPRTSAAQSSFGTAVSKNDLKFGDLVFFNTTGEKASHVGIYIGDDLFAHASVSLGVTISSLQSTYFVKRYESARRIFQ